MRLHKEDKMSEKNIEMMKKLLAKKKEQQSTKNQPKSNKNMGSSANAVKTEKIGNRKV